MHRNKGSGATGGCGAEQGGDSHSGGRLLLHLQRHARSGGRHLWQGLLRQLRRAL